MGRGLLLLVVFLVLGGCRVDAVVSISVDDRGGEVRVSFEADREAVSVIAGPASEPGRSGSTRSDSILSGPILSGGVEAADLRRAGWEVGPARRTGEGGVVIEASKRFERPERLGAVVEELSGPEGPLREFRLLRERGLVRVRHRLSGRIDLDEPGATLSGIGNDPGLPQRLEAAGVDPARLAELLAGRAAGGFGLAVTVDLPGAEPVRVEARNGEVVEVRAAASRLDAVRSALLAAAVVLGLAALLTLVIRPRHQPRDPL